MFGWFKKKDENAEPPVVYTWNDGNNTHSYIQEDTETTSRLIDPKDLKHELGRYADKRFIIKHEQHPTDKAKPEASQPAPKSASLGRRFRSTAAARDRVKGK
tara:strand:- start:66 stop:371 length:306 start_codon:yes stop_codon:yes gene_type:complete